MADASVRVSGIYIIRNVLDGKVYVGSAKTLRRRLAEHKRKLLRGLHENDRLQNAFTKYGAASFEFAVLEYVEGRERLLVREQHWIDALGCANRDVGYNIYSVAGSPVGTKHTEEARRKMREAAKTKPPVSAATRAKLSAALKGRKKSPEEIENHRRSLAGYKHTDETKAKVSAAGIGRRRSAAATEKIAAAHRGLKRSPEAKAKMALAAKRRGISAACIQASIASNLGRKHSDETIEKMRAAARLAWARRRADAELEHQ